MNNERRLENAVRDMCAAIDCERARFDGETFGLRWGFFMGFVCGGVVTLFVLAVVGP